MDECKVGLGVSVYPAEFSTDHYTSGNYCLVDAYSSGVRGCVYGVSDLGYDDVKGLWKYTAIPGGTTCTSEATGPTPYTPCPDGQRYDGVGCSAICPAGQTYSGGSCLCPSGQHVSGSACVADSTGGGGTSGGGTVTCPTGQHVSNGVCVADSTGGGTVTCPTGQHVDNGVCVADSTGGGTVTCPTGQHVDNGVCVADSTGGGTVTCPAGQHVDNGACVTDSTGGGGAGGGGGGDGSATPPSLGDPPTMGNILSPLTGLFADFRSWSMPGHSSVCPTPSFQAFGKTFVLDAHCTLIEKNRSILAAMMAAVWVLVSILVILSA